MCTSLEEESFSLLLKIYSLFENFKLKDQKVSKTDIEDKLKQKLEYQKECPASKFKPFQGLKTDDQKSLLQKVRD